MDDLKPCPICGGKGSAKKTYEPDWWQVVFSHENDCPLGKVSNPYKSAYSTESEAIAAWNRRAQLSAQSVSAVQPVATAEEYLRKQYGGYRAHAEWRALEEAFNAGRAADADAVDAKRWRAVRNDPMILIEFDSPVSMDFYETPEGRDAAADAAMAQSTEGAKG